MTPGATRRTLRLLAVALGAALLVGACSDGSGSSADATTTTAPGTGEPVVDGVAVELTGSVEQTFTGGACTLGDGLLQIVAGYSTGLGPPRPQGSPHANGTMQIIIDGEEGEQENIIVNLVRESDGQLILAETGTAVVGKGLTSGTFETQTVTGSWTCPEVLGPEELAELTERMAS